MSGSRYGFFKRGLMWARFSSTGTCDVSKELFTIATIIGASSLVHDLSSQVGIGSRLQDLSGEDSMMPMTSSLVVGENESSVAVHHRPMAPRDPECPQDTESRESLISL